jgi:hypothetical protein
VKNTHHFERDLMGLGQEIPCANASNPLGRPEIARKRAPFFIAAPESAMKNTQFFAQDPLRAGLFLGLDGPRCLV